MNIRQTLGISCFVAAVIAIARFTSRESDQNKQIQLQAFNSTLPIEAPAQLAKTTEQQNIVVKKPIISPKPLKIEKKSETSATKELIKKHFFGQSWKDFNDKDIEAYFQKIKVIPVISQESVGSKSFRKTWTAKFKDNLNSELSITGLSDPEGKVVTFAAAVLTQDLDEATWQGADRIVTDLTNEKLSEQRISDTFQFWKTESFRTVSAEKTKSDNAQIKWIFEYASE